MSCIQLELMSCNARKGTHHNVETIAFDVNETLLDLSALDVEAQQVIPIEAGAADGRLVVEAGVWEVPVLVMQPRV